MPVHDLSLTTAHRLRDALFIAVGLGVIGATNLRARLEPPSVDLTSLTGAVDSLTERFDAATHDLDARLSAIEARVDLALDQLEDGLPGPAREAMANARGVAQEARAHLRSLAGRAA